MKSPDFMDMSPANQLSVNDIIRNLFKLLAFKYKNHDAYFTRVTEYALSQDDYLIRDGF